MNDPTRDNSTTDAEEALFQRLLRRLGEVKQSAVRWSRNSRFCGCGCSWKRRSQRQAASPSTMMNRTEATAGPRLFEDT